MIHATQGNIELLQLKKTAFLCSRKIPATAVLKCYDWAIAQRDNGHCVISGFHSALEKDVLHYLLKGTQPIILASARGLTGFADVTLYPHIQSGRLLIISPFNADVTRITAQTARIRNAMMVALADRITTGYASPKGQLEGLLKNIAGKKDIEFLIDN